MARLAALNFVRGVIFNFLLCWSEGMYFTIRSLFCLILTKSGTLEIPSFHNMSQCAHIACVVSFH